MMYIGKSDSTQQLSNSTLLPRSFSEPVLHSFELLCLTLGAQCLAEFLDHSELNVQHTSLDWCASYLLDFTHDFYWCICLDIGYNMREWLVSIVETWCIVYMKLQRYHIYILIYIYIHIFADTNTNPWNLIHTSMHTLHTVHPEPQFYFVSAVHGWFWCAACFSNLVDKKWQEYPRTPWVLLW